MTLDAHVSVFLCDVFQLDGDAEEHEENGADLEEEEEEEKKSSDRRKKKKAKKPAKEEAGTASYTGIGIKVRRRDKRGGCGCRVAAAAHSLVVCCVRCPSLACRARLTSCLAVRRVWWLCL